MRRLGFDTLSLNDCPLRWLVYDAPVFCRVALALLVPALAFAAPRAPTSASYRKTFERNASTLVEVIGPHRHGPGVVVGANGEVLTSVEYVGLVDAKVRIEGRELPAKVILANASLRVAIVKLDEPPGLRAPAVRTGEPLETQGWLIAIGRTKKGPQPQLGQLKKTQRSAPFYETTLYVPPGTPVFDPQGRLVGVAVRRGKTGSLVLPVPAVKSELAARGPP